MKNFAGFVPSDRRAWHRAQLLELLGGNEALMDQIERAENDYLFFVSGVARSTESDRSIHDDLKALSEALEVIQSIYNPGGAAKALFEGEAFRLVGETKLQQLRDLFQDVPGEGLVMAARAALDKHQLEGGRPTDPQKLERLRLVATVAFIAEQAGIKKSRKGSLPRLMSYVFDRVGLEIEPDGDIKAMLEKARK